MTNGTEFKFDHSKPASKAKDMNGKPVLMQGVHMFTNAEWNRFTERYEPEPQYVDHYEPYKEFLAPKVLALIEGVHKLEDILSALIEPLKLVVSLERIFTNAPLPEEVKPEEVKAEGPGKLTPISDVNEFIRLNKANFQKWVQNNNGRIGLLEPEDPMLDAIIKKWENFFGEEPLII